MKRFYLLFPLLICLVFQGFAQTTTKEEDKLTDHHPSREGGPFLYTLTTFNEPYTALSDTVSLNNGAIWDDPDYFIPLEYPFLLNDNLIVYLEWHGAGFQLRSSTAGGDDTYVIPFEAGLIDRGISEGISLSPISYKVDGEPGDRIIKIEMKNAGSQCEFYFQGTTNMFINLQLWLYENENIVEFRFGENTISNLFTFYGCYAANLGITDIDRIDSTYINPHFLEGSATSPVLGTTSQQLTSGIPVEGTVYRLTPIPPISVIVMGTNSTSFCDPNGSATAIVTGGMAPYTFLWNNGDTTSTINNLEDDIYVVTVTDQSGNTKTGVVFITNVDPIYPDLSMTLETDVDANDGTATSSAVGGNPPYSYAWSNGDTTHTIINLAPATYTITVTDSEGCTATQSIIVNHFGCDDLGVDVYPSGASCAGLCDGYVEVDAYGGVGPYTYTLSEGGGQGLCAGLYHLTVTDADGCGDIASFFIFENEGVFFLSGTTKETAPFANDGTAWVEPIEGMPPFSYEWNNGALDSLLTNLEPGSYSVTVSDANGCMDSTTVDVEAFGCAAYTESFIARDFCLDSCSWRISTLLVPGVGPLDYTWSTGDTTISIENLCPGTYALTIVDEGYGDCTFVEEFEILPTDYVEGVVDTVIHVTNSTAGAISITAIAGQNIYEYRWSGPNWYSSFEEDISGLLPGYYSVEIKSYWGCARIDSIEVKDLTVSTRHLGNHDAHIYPNPASDQVIIEMENVGEYSIELISLDGRKIKTWEGENVLDVSEITVGNYLLEFRSSEGVFRKKLTISR